MPLMAGTVYAIFPTKDGTRLLFFFFQENLRIEVNERK